MDSRRYYLLTLLPPLPGLGEPLPIAFAEALERLRQQGGRDLERLAQALEVEAPLREALDEWVLNPPGSRVVPTALPPPIAALFDEELAAGRAEELWVEAVWQAWFDALARVGGSIGSRLLPRWAAWEASLRLRLAQRRGLPGAERRHPAPAGKDWPEHAEILAAWAAARERGRAVRWLAAAMEAEEVLERARLDFLERENPRYAFTVDELVAYLLKLRLLERRRRLDPEKGRALLRGVAAL